MGSGVDAAAAAGGADTHTVTEETRSEGDRVEVKP